MEKPVGEITDADWIAHPVWEFALDSESSEDRDETWMRPVESLPVSDLENRLVSVPLRLANGSVVRGVLGNISLRSPRKTRAFISVSASTPKGAFSVVRDPNFTPSYSGEGKPERLAELFGLSMQDVFPISYDLTGLAVGPPETIKDSIPPYPAEKLSDKERMDLIFSDN